MPRIFGREPALWLGLFAITLKALSAFAFHATVDQQAIVNAVAAAAVGLFVALMTRDGVVAALLGMVQAVIALGVGFGLHVSADTQAVLMSFAAAVVAMFVRTQVIAPVPASPPSKAVQGT